MAGIVTALLGLIDIIGWQTHWRLAVQLVPGSAPMHFNTALCFILSGTGLILLTTRHDKLAQWLGGATACFTLLTLLQYITGRDFGIDLLFSTPYFEVNRIHSGRMSALTAVCFILLGFGIVLAGGRKRSPRWLTGTGLLSCIALVIVVVALLGFAFGIQEASSWGAYARMAFNSTITLLCLGSGLFVWSWQAARGEQANFSRWVPVTGSMTLIVMIVIVFAGSLAELKQAVFWRGHTYQVLNVAGAFIGNLNDTQRGMRGYLLTASPEALEAYSRATNAAPRQVTQLAELTRDNPVQQKNIVKLGADLGDVLAYSRQLLGTNAGHGLAAAIQLEKNGRGLAVMNRARADLDVFTREEQRLLVERDALTATYFNHTTGLLVFGSVVAVGLLVLANLMAGREVKCRKRSEEIHQELNVLYSHTLSLQNAILSSANYAIISANPRGVVTTFNATAERWLGYTAVEVVGKTTPALWHDAGEVAARAEVLSAELGRPVEPGFETLVAKARMWQVDENEWTLIRKDGRRFPVTLSATALFDKEGNITGYLGVIADITERKQAEERLRESEERFRRAFDGAPIGMSLVGPEGRWLKVNQALCDMTGYSEAELLQTDFQHVTHPDDLEKDLGLVRQVLAGEINSYQMEKRYLHKQGGHVPVMLSVSLVRDQQESPLYFVAQIEAIAARKLAEEKVVQSLREKEALLREIHHRVKNNMQVISSILQLQTKYIKDPVLLDVFKDCQGRIRTMGLIHEKLYRSEGLAQIDFKEYLESLVSLLLRSQTPKGVVLRNELHIAPVCLDVDTAIPLGLIANELVCNSLKHAFTGRPAGHMRISLSQIDHGRLQLEVQDDGKGLPSGFDPDKTSSLGVRLVKILSGQINGKMDFNGENGARFAVSFDLAQPKIKT